jgi:catechol 2,3-dioxygenase-like lactoylglutathione lyase family enzyme
MLGKIAPTPMLAVKDLGKAKRFYEGILGLEPVRNGMPEVITYKAGDSSFVVYQSQYAGTNKATALTWPVGDALDRQVAELKAKGVAFEHYDLPETVRQGDIHVSGPIRNAWFKDPDGNIHGLASA